MLTKLINAFRRLRLPAAVQPKDSFVYPSFRIINADDVDGQEALFLRYLIEDEGFFVYMESEPGHYTEVYVISKPDDLGRRHVIVVSTDAYWRFREEFGFDLVSFERELTNEEFKFAASAAEYLSPYFASVVETRWKRDLVR